MPETDEERRKRWAANAAKSYMTPQMMHAMNMSKYQSQNKYKADYEKTKAKGYTPVASTPETERVKVQSERLSSVKYKRDFEKSKAKFTQVADNPEQQRLRKMTELSSTVHYKGKQALAQSKRRREGASPRVTRREIKEEEPPVKTQEENSNQNERDFVEEDIQETEVAQEGVGDYGPGGDNHDTGMDYDPGQGQDEPTNYEPSDAYQADDGGKQAVYDTAEVQEDVYDQVEDNHDYDNNNEEGYPEQEGYVGENSGYDAPAQNNETGEDVYESVEGEEGNLDDFYASLN